MATVLDLLLRHNTTAEARTVADLAAARSTYWANVTAAANDELASVGSTKALRDALDALDTDVAAFQADVQAVLDARAAQSAVDATDAELTVARAKADAAVAARRAAQSALDDAQRAEERASWAASDMQATAQRHRQSLADARDVEAELRTRGYSGPALTAPPPAPPAPRRWRAKSTAMLDNQTRCPAGTVIEQPASVVMDAPWESVPSDTPLSPRPTPQRVQHPQEPSERMPGAADRTPRAEVTK